MSLSLPIPSYTLVDLQLYFIYQDNAQIPQKITLNLMSDSSAEEIAR
jgi:ubiquitin carboxyl-terminal hydrolase 4/11/15